MKLFFLAFLIGLISSCGPKVIDTVNGAEVTETAQQVGDMMASVDEIGGVNGGTIALMEHSKKTFARLTPENTKENYFLKLILPEAHAINCDATTGGFSTC